MGWNTYHQIVTELSPDEWIYNDFTTYVVTHKPKTSSKKIHFINECPVELVKNLREEKGKGIWICGGANLIEQLVREDIIDCLFLFWYTKRTGTYVPVGERRKIYVNAKNVIVRRSPTAINKYLNTTVVFFVLISLL